MSVKEAPKEWMKDHTFQLIRSIRDLKEFLERGESFPKLGFDLETDNLNAWKANVCGICLAWERSHGVYIPIDHKLGTHLNLDAKEVWGSPVAGAAKEEAKGVQLELRGDICRAPATGLPTPPLHPGSGVSPTCDQ